MTDLATLLGALDNGERVRGRGFERLCKWMLENEPEYATQLERVWPWDEWPGNLGRSDAGIDLVARTHDGKLWAIQAKHYGPDRRITQRRRELVPRRGGPVRLQLRAPDHVGQRRQRPPRSRNAR
jgi:predicted helicase